MRIPSLLCAAFLVGANAQAQDKNPWYIQYGLGIVGTTDAEDVVGGSVSFDPGFTTGLAIGRSYAIDQRLTLDAEAELYYQYFTVDEEDLGNIPSAVDNDAKTFGLMLNGTLDWAFTQQYSLYGGLGLGYMKEIEYSAWDSGNLQVQDDDGVAFQARLGMAYNLGGTYDVRFGYRFFKTQPIDIENTTTGEVDELDVSQHAVELGFRWGL
jgi:opacity protein-like surface antigen